MTRIKMTKREKGKGCVQLREYRAALTNPKHPPCPPVAQHHQIFVKDSWRRILFGWCQKSPTLSLMKIKVPFLSVFDKDFVSLSDMWHCKLSAIVCPNISQMAKKSDIFIIVLYTSPHPETIQSLPLICSFRCDIRLRRHFCRLTVPMMTAQLMVPLGYSPTLEARICELPLQARRWVNIFETLLSLNLSRMSMFLILPDSLNPGIQSMEANMTTETIKALMTTLQVTYTQPLVRFSN